MAVYVISDIHGYLNRMFDVLDQAKFNWEKDELYILGDLIDRGPQSAEALIWAVDEAPLNVHFLLGNHEDMAYEALKYIQDDMNIDAFMCDNVWSWNGGLNTLDSLREECGSQWCHKAAEWINNLPLYYNLTINDKKILLVHAGICTGNIRLSDDFIENGRNEMIDIPEIGEVWSQHLLWLRYRWFYDKKSYPYDYIIFGHTPTSIDWWADINPSDEEIPIVVQGSMNHIIKLSGYENGHIRYCIDTGRKCMGLLRLDDMAEFYSEKEE